MPVNDPVRIVTRGRSNPVRIDTNGTPVRIVTHGGMPVRIVTGGPSDPIKITGDIVIPIQPLYSRIVAKTSVSMQTIIIKQITPIGNSVRIAWGDGEFTIVIDGFILPISHIYNIAKTYSITFTNPDYIQTLIIEDDALGFNSGTISKFLVLRYLALQ